MLAGLTGPADLGEVVALSAGLAVLASSRALVALLVHSPSAVPTAFWCWPLLGAAGPTVGCSWAPVTLGRSVAPLVAFATDLVHAESTGFFFSRGVKPFQVCVEVFEVVGCLDSGVESEIVRAAAFSFDIGAPNADCCKISLEASPR